MASLSKKRQSDIEQAAILIVDKERTNWEDAVCYVTEKVGFRMRELIRTCRKNYWGVFDNPIDPTTSREKVWTPLAQSTVEDVVKNVDLDQKDCDFRAKQPEGYEITDITRAYIQDELGKIFFGETLDETERQACIDGTTVWKTWEENGKMMRRTVDLLHVYIDPSEQSIQDAFRFTERALMTPDELESMTGWDNTEDITGSTVLSKNDIRVGSGGFQGIPTTGRFVDVWECWGKIPKWLVTGNKKEDMEYIDGHIIVSGLEAGDPRVHLIEENTKIDETTGKVLKPYEELRLAKIAGRWYGLGIVERLLALQEYLNTVTNIRINRNYISQLGLFKIRKGSGVTGQMLRNLPSNGAISVNSMDDVDQFNVNPVDETSYRDEEVIKAWTQAVTQAYPVSTGQNLPASQTATAVATQAASAKDGYTMMIDAIGFFLERWMDRHALPIYAKNIKINDIVRISGDDEKFKALAESTVAHLVREQLDELYAKGIVPSEMEVQNAMQNELEQMMKRPDMFVKASRGVIASQLYTKFYVRNEDLDTTVTVQNLIQTLNLAPEYHDATIKQIYDLMGLPQPRKNQQPQGQPMSPDGQQSAPTAQPQAPQQPSAPVNSPQQALTQAITPQFNG